jgi:hypothetical protein
MAQFDAIIAQAAMQSPTLIPDPNKIGPGMFIIIPDPPTEVGIQQGTN